MSKEVMIRIRCDAQDCNQLFDGNRLGARQNGWTRDYDCDHCPTHSAPDYRVETVRQLAGRGVSDGRIGIRLGVSRDTVRKLRGLYGIPGQRPGRPLAS